MLVFAYTTVSESAVQLLKCMDVFSSHLRLAGKDKPVVHAQRSLPIYLALRASYNLHAWLTGSLSSTADLVRARTLLETAEEILPALDGGSSRLCNSELAMTTRLQGVHGAKFPALRAFEDQTLNSFAHATNKEKLRLLVQLKKIRDQQAKLAGFENYIEVRQRFDLSIDTPGAISFLTHLNDGATSLCTNARDERDRCDPSTKNRSIVFDNILPITGVRRLLEIIVRDEFGLDLVSLNADCDSTRELMLFELCSTCEVIGYVLFDLRVKEPGFSGNRTLPITQRASVEDSIQLPIVLCSCEVNSAGGKISYGALLSIFHEFGHALDHVLDKKEGLSARPVDELEVASRYVEHILRKSMSNGAFESVFPKVMNESLKASIKLMLRNQFLIQTPVELLFSLFELKLYQSNDVSRVEDVASLFNKAQAKITCAHDVSFETMLGRFSVASVAKYQCANYAYLWSHSFIAESSSLAAAECRDGGLHGRLTEYQCRDSRTRSARLIKTLSTL
ncbi:M3 family metallopeptidase [Pseudomonas sp. FP2196]|uniref:M3 family metallopeptidase n=1 Tax=Pseudomonas sp. FP2196 TaxID=2954086 RepID=UPI002733B54F|nr:M3 family metallopeptidase [Pseudomonas sp. FP2196]WLH37105.1 M3 family metallopeptidase [Pseudomonas sp. FP2196]